VINFNPVALSRAPDFLLGETSICAQSHLFNRTDDRIIVSRQLDGWIRVLRLDRFQLITVVVNLEARKFQAVRRGDNDHALVSLNYSLVSQLE
jgi:hypothetical protein